MKTIKKKVHATLKEKGSRFIGYLFNVASVDQFEDQLNRLTSKYRDASHHCYGWRIGIDETEEYAHDAAEPSGTAGLPILNQLRSYEVINAGLVVIRYFGGTKLGRSGLIRAYSQTAELCLEKARYIRIVPTLNLKVVYPYNLENEIERLMNRFRLKELDTDYTEQVSKTVACPREHAEECIAILKSLEHAGIELQLLEKSYLKK